MYFPRDFESSDFIVDGVRIDLEEFPHIQERVHRTWGTRDCLSYLNRLIAGTEDRVACVDQRLNQRVGRGFPMHFVVKLLNLIDQHPKYEDPKPVRLPAAFENWIHQP